MYIRGLGGVPSDFAEVIRWTRLSADRGFSGAETMLGIYYEGGIGVPQDYQEALKWYRKACDQGHPVAQYQLAVMYQDGLGVPQDLAQAFELLRKSAEQGCADAQFMLGWIYEAMNNDQEASHWFSLAAEQGVTDFRSRLVGVPGADSSKISAGGVQETESN